MTPRLAFALTLAMLGCNRVDDVEVTDRDPADRTPLTAPCDDSDAVRCLLPWPSNRYTKSDPATETGLRLAIEPSSIPVADDLAVINRSDGFSRIAGMAVAFRQEVDQGAVDWDATSSLSPDGTLQVIVAQPGHPRYGDRIAYRTEWVDAGSVLTPLWLLIGRPVQVMPANADHLLVVTDAVGVSDRPRHVALALGLVEPTTREEADLVGWHAPTRAALEAAGVDVDRVVRVSSFTTRSATDPTRALHHMMDVLDERADDIGVQFDGVVLNSTPEVAAIVLGRLTGAPSFLDARGHLAIGADGLPEVTGTTEIRFRLSVPNSGVPYRVALYGHGTGGDVTDPAFDRELAGENIAKLNIRFDGWTGDDFINTLVGFSSFFDGSARSTAGLLQALAGGTVLLTALDGPLGDLLAGDTLGGDPNPAAGVRPLTDDVVWVGGSMGGTMGAVIVSADPRLQAAVLNVPGAGWTHMVPYSLLYESGIESILSTIYGNELDMQLGMLMAQNNWDDVDGAVWADEALDVGGVFLLQQSMEDPVLPNVGTELLANALGAVQFEPFIQPIVGLTSTSGVVTTGAAIEQFRVPNTGQYDIHGFAARDTIGKQAAMQQILEMLTTYWDGAPQMSHPPLCTELGTNGTCDLVDAWQ